MKKDEILTLRTSTETKKALEEIAKKEDRSLSYIINRIIQEYLKTKSTLE